MSGISPFTRTAEFNLADYGGEGVWKVKSMSNGIRKEMKETLIEIGKREGLSIRELNNEEIWGGLMQMYGDGILCKVISECVIEGPGVENGKLPMEVIDELPQEVLIGVYEKIEEISKFPLVRNAGAATNNVQ